jgi:HAD superfamily hydrolase (TIGR01509 family)
VAAEAVIFDLDGILLDSEEVWAKVREKFVRERGGRWHEDAQREMMGMSSKEWSRYMAEELRVPLSPQEISDQVAERVREVYRRDLPLIPGAVDAVRRVGAVWRLGLASSANRPLIDFVLELAGLAQLFAVTISSEEVPRGKPAPDVYLEASTRLGVETSRAAAVEDSGSGMVAAREAGLGVIAIPNRDFPPDREALQAADAVVESIDELTPQVVEAVVAQAQERDSGSTGRRDENA